jgi:glycine oxidase
MKVTVIGAGIAGLAVGYELASRGAAVRLVDMRGPGLGATRASAGILAPYVEGHSDALLQLGICGLNHYDRFIARVTADAGLEIDYRRTGTLQVARTAAEAERLGAMAARLAAAGTEHALLDGAGARRVEAGIGEVAGALLVPQHGYVAVAPLVTALTAALARRGVQVALERIDDVGAEASRADAVVVAAGSWSGPAIRPVRGQLLHLRLPQPPASRVLWGEGCYAVPWQDGSVLVGATSEDVGFDESATAAGVRLLLERGAELLPALERARFQEVRVGLRPATADELPVVGPSSTMRGVFYATGHYRNGILLAPWTALAVADLVLDGRERAELTLTRPDRVGL